MSKLFSLFMLAAIICSGSEFELKLNKSSFGVYNPKDSGITIKQEFSSVGIRITAKTDNPDSKKFGRAASTTGFFKPAQEYAIANNLEMKGLNITIEYDGDNLPSLYCYSHSMNDRGHSAFLKLKKGVNEYQINTLARYPLEQLKTLQFRPQKDLDFTVRKLTITMQPTLKQIITIPVEITQEKKTVEITPAHSSTFTDFYRRPGLEPLAAQSPLTASAKWNNNQLSFSIDAAFQDKPRAQATRHDDLGLWRDDCLELFFSPQLDNEKFIHFAINADGTVMDYRRDYCTEACQVRSMYEFNLEHRKNIRFEQGMLHTELDFPLEQLGADPAKQRLMGFQMTQKFSDKGEKFHSLCWSPTERNTIPANFGLLYFNRSPFGAGEIKIDKISISEPANVLNIEYTASGFTAQKLSMELILTSPDNFVRREKLQFNPSAKTLEVKGIKNLNGVYTLTLVANAPSGAIKPFAVNFVHKKPIEQPFAQKQLFPFPKKCEYQDGVFPARRFDQLVIDPAATARTRRTAELFAEKLAGFAGKYRIVEQGTGISLKIDPQGLKPEGYHIRVTPDKVEITGADEPGLFYGTVSFIQLLKLDMFQDDKAPVRCCEITDWPDLPVRLATFWHPNMLPNPVNIEKAEPEFLLNYLDTFVSGTRMNTLRIRGLETLLPLDDIHPNLNFNPKSRYYSVADLERLGQFCRDRFITLIIAISGGSHAGWLHYLNPEFRQKGWLHTGNVTHPDYEKYYFAVADKFIKATGCEYFSPVSDEWWHKRHPKEEVPNEDHAAKFLNFHLNLHRFLKERGVKMVICEDMLNPMHSGVKFDNYRNIDKLPKDITIMIWANIGNAAKYFLDKGFPVWISMTGASAASSAQQGVSGYGNQLYSFGREHKFRVQETFSFHSQWLHAANTGWNYYTGEHLWLPDFINSGVATIAESVIAQQPNPAWTSEFSTIDLSGILNDTLPGIKTGKRDILDIPADIAATSPNCLKIDPQKPALVPIKQKLSSLIFLHTAIPGDEYIKSGYRNRQWHKGYPAADYRVTYADGSSANIPVRINMQIYYFNHQPQAGGTVFGRCMDITYDSEFKPQILYQYEWVNPHPDNEIASITFGHPHKLDFQTYVVAVTGRRPRL